MPAGAHTHVASAHGRSQMYGLVAVACGFPTSVPSAARVRIPLPAVLGSSGIGSTIVKPCGLVDGDGGKHALAVAHDDRLPTADYTVARADVSRAGALYPCACESPQLLTSRC